ncbi:3-hydroxyanthranilate 3,4-dioxygenase [Tolypocladium ophioglossoides CBS 100239]|uniref:3-hydroxyanthranilate 3,4-dioxygenase n=1 Tax=Tolypocladium ophioglossoides (strain CBS 100239) TaxID=1163406 RepID=A0A0L0NLQ9_TOLOC|nr:3-hydroxyanthranilate 3,4-dioxygenase [Tolypocladium ophioglossoides CBS 100239]
MLGPPLNVPKWLEENGHLLKPPINNYCVYNDDVTVMIVGGPNARTDYHINQTAEWFYQHRGAMLLKVVDGGVFRDIVIGEGSMFMLPPDTPHNPVRFADTVGIVLEQRRPEGSLDRMRWYCARCDGAVVVHEAAFHCTDLGTQIKAAVEDFRADEAKRTCARCGELADWAPKPGSIPDPNLEAKP